MIRILSPHIQKPVPSRLIISLPWLLLLLLLAAITPHVTAHGLFAFGDMSDGQLGDENSMDGSDLGVIYPRRLLPLQVPLSGPMSQTEIVQVDGGGHTTMFLSDKGQMYATGLGEVGQLGASLPMETGQHVSSPIEIPTPESDMYGKKIVQFSLGMEHAVFLDQDGAAYSVGGGAFHGQLGLGIFQNINTPRRVESYATSPKVPLQQGDRTGFTSEIIQNAPSLKPLPAVSLVVAGYYHSFFIAKDTGLVYACGASEIYQLGLNTTVDQPHPVRIALAGDMHGEFIVKASGGSYHSLFLSKSGKVFASGMNGFGQYADGTTVHSTSHPVSVTSHLGEAHPLYNEKVVEISAGGYFSLLLTESGHLWGAGSNTRGELGMGRYSVFQALPVNVSQHGHARRGKISKVAAGYHFAHVQLASSGDILHIGDNSYGQSASNSSKRSFPIPLTCWESASVFGVGMSTGFVHDLKPCGVGSYWNLSSEICIECPEGHFCREEYAYYNPAPCSPFTWSLPGAHTSDLCTMENCGEGFICQSGTRKACEKGKWSILGSNHCTNCPKGYICLGDGRMVRDMSFSAWIQSTTGVIVFLSSSLFLGGLLIVITFFCVVVVCSIRTKRIISLSDKRIKLLEDYITPAGDEDDLDKATLLVKNSLMEIDYSELVIEKEIGRGGGGSLVLLGTWNRTRPVAIKLFPVSRLDQQQVYDAFEKELSLMSSLRHPSLVAFLGCSLVYPKLALIMEYCDNGSLMDCIQKKKLVSRSKAQIYSMIHNICDGMSYLHKKGVLHRDLKPANIFVTSSFETRIGDFGLSKYISNMSEKKGLTVGLIGTSYYTSPEVSNGLEYDAKSDVFSFGMLLFELLTCRMEPFAPLFTPVQAQLRIANDEHFRPSVDPILKSRFSEKAWIVEKCWSANPEERPSFEELKEYFAPTEEPSSPPQAAVLQPSDIEMEALF